MLDDDPPGQSGGTGGNKSGSRAGHQRLPVVHRDQGLAGRVRMAERSTKTLLSAVSTTAAWIYDVAAGRRVGWHAWVGTRGLARVRGVVAVPWLRCACHTRVLLLRCFSVQLQCCCSATTAHVYSRGAMF